MTATPPTPHTKALQGDDRIRTGESGGSISCRENVARGVPLLNRDGQILAFAVVDPDDWDYVSGIKWRLHQADTKRYATSRSGERRLFMHRLLLGLERSDPRRVDHINGDSLNNRRANLKIVTTAGNAQNQGSRGGTSSYRGVSWDRSRGKWMARAMLNGRGITIGRFATEDEAAAAAAEWRRRHMPHSSEGMAA